MVFRRLDTGRIQVIMKALQFVHGTLIEVASQRIYKLSVIKIDHYYSEQVPFSYDTSVR